MRGPLEDCVQAGAPSSRRDEAAAGWYVGLPPQPLGRWPQQLDARRQAKWDSFSWLTVRALLESANDVIARRAPTIVRDRRRRYVAAQRAAGAEREDHGPATSRRGSFGPDFVVDWTALEQPRFLIVGDPGEADASQYATIDPLQSIHEGGPPWERPHRKKSDFMVVMSDVIYPAGDVNDYINGFYIPFGGYDGPIYALPGNHDWYDGLSGFMYHFCAAEPLAPLRFNRLGRRLSDRLVRALWQRASRPDRDALAPFMTARRRQDLRRGPHPAPDPPPAPRPVQPASYYAVELQELILVAIDTGVTGELDAEQAEWLLRVSRRDKPKVLLTGKPIWAGNGYHCGAIAWGDGGDGRPYSVDDIVRDPDHGYVAAIGGDVHNYQRYPIQVRGRTIQYIVSGGGGAYLSATHTIPTVGPDAWDGPPDDVEFSEEQFRCYPLRGDSLALFCRRVGPLLFKALVTALAVAAVAAALVLWLVDVDAARARAAIATAGGVAAVAVALLVVAKVRAPLVAAHRSVAMLVVAVLAVGGTVAALLGLDDHRATIAAVVAIGVPLAAVAGLLIAYATRGSLTNLVPDALFVAPALGLAPALWAPYGLGAAADALLYGLAPALAVPALVALSRRLRGQDARGPAGLYRALVAILWLGLGAALIERFGDRWMEISLLAVLGLLAVVAYVVPRLGPGRRQVRHPRYDAVGPEAGAIVALSLAGLALVALDALAGADAPAVVAAGVAAVIGLAMALAALYLLLLRGLINPRTLWYVRTGMITPAGAASFVSAVMGVGRAPTRPGEPSATDRRRAGMANVIRRLGSFVSVIADTNEPPFYKSFLSAEVADGCLEIRCWGVTGYDDPERSPSLEDCVSIPLARTAGAYETDDALATNDVRPVRTPSA